MENYAHVRCIMESETLLTDPRFKTIIDEQGLVGRHGQVNASLSVYCVGNASTTVHLLHEESDKAMPWSVFDVCFGEECRSESAVEFSETELGQQAFEREAYYDASNTYVPISRERCPAQRVFRAGKESYKFCVCHTLNKSSWHAVFNPALSMYTYCINNQVDFIMGDGNQHYQFCSKAHKTRVQAEGREGDTQNCLFNQILRGFVNEINSSQEFPHRLGYTIVDNNPVEAQEKQEDLDCIFCHIFGWGKQASCSEARQKMMNRVEELLQKYNARQSQRASTLLYYNGHHMNDEDREWLADHSDDRHPCFAPEDYHVKVSERVKHMTRGDLWLGENDCDWHLPLLINLREMPLRNQRARSSSGWQATLEKKEKFRAKRENRQWEPKSKSKEQWYEGESWKADSSSSSSWKW